MKKTVLTIFALSLLIQNFTFAQSNYTIQTPSNSSLSGYALYVPAGITTRVVLSRGINSNSAVVGDTISAILSDDLMYNNALVAPSGSVVQGTIVQASKAKYGNINAKISAKFTTITTPYGNVIPISAVIATTDGTGVLKGAATSDSAKEYAKNMAIGAGSGAILGTIAGAIASNTSVGKGAVIGTAVGAGSGVIKGAMNKGQDIIIPANSEIDIYFNQPITLGGK